MNEDTKDLTLLGSKATKYPEKPEDVVLETFQNPYPQSDYTVTLETSEFTSLCPKTGQPDFGRIIVQYGPGPKCIESKAFKLYMFSFRNQGAFWERLTNRILFDLVQAVQPKWMSISATMNARGGIPLMVQAFYSQQTGYHGSDGLRRPA